MSSQRLRAGAGARAGAGDRDGELLLFILQGCFNMQSRSSAAAALGSAAVPELDSVFLVGRGKKKLD